MKYPKESKRFCPRCKKHTAVTASQMKQRARNSARPSSKGSKLRVRGRGLRRGAGNFGKYSKTGIKAKKLTKKIVIKFVCKECKKAHQTSGIRAKKMEFI